jgi:protein-disulfide isomerase
MRILVAVTAFTFLLSSAVFAAEPKEEKSTEPNLKITRDSGGKSTSSLITDAPVMGDYVMGKESAPIIMIEYASMTCPHCAHFSNNVMPEIEKKYIDTGKMRYILRQFPLNEPALKAAMLLDCVGEQNTDKYYVFARVLFDAQSKWAFDGNYMSGLETISNVGGLSKEQFQGCLNNTDREMKMLKIKKLANDELRLPHTPYIFIDGEVFEGDRSVEEVSKFIDAKLSQKH